MVWVLRYTGQVWLGRFFQEGRVWLVHRWHGGDDRWSVIGMVRRLGFEEEAWLGLGRGKSR